MPGSDFDVEIIDLDADELGEFDALAVCRDPTGPAEDDEEVPADDQDRLPEVADEA